MASELLYECLSMMMGFELLITSVVLRSRTVPLKLSYVSMAPLFWLRNRSFGLLGLSDMGFYRGTPLSMLTMVGSLLNELLPVVFGMCTGVCTTVFCLMEGCDCIGRNMGMSY
jgi:hypothetical protein